MPEIEDLTPLELIAHARETAARLLSVYEIDPAARTILALVRVLEVYQPPGKPPTAPFNAPEIALLIADSTDRGRRDDNEADLAAIAKVLGVSLQSATTGLECVTTKVNFLTAADAAWVKQKAEKERG